MIINYYIYYITGGAKYLFFLLSNFDKSTDFNLKHVFEGIIHNTTRVKYVDDS